MSSELSSNLAALRRAFSTASDKYTAHQRACPILQQMAASSVVFTEVARRHLARPDALSMTHYPVVSMDIETNAHFGLVANCWIPLPDGNTNMSTKAIHHHGDMLLTTVTAFGPGYEHWQFTTPAVADAGRERYAMRLLERAPHPTGHASFVDANIPHVPFYPPSLTITYALWSSRRPTSWKDSLKRVPALHKHSAALRDLAASFGLTRALDLKIAHYFDFTPTPDGFRGMKDRKEFDRGPNEDYLYSLFHILQRTGNEALAADIRRRQNDVAPGSERLLAALLNDLAGSRPIAGRLSPGHYDIPFANFPAEEIERALAACAASPVLAAAGAAHGR